MAAATRDPFFTNHDLRLQIPRRVRAWGEEQGSVRPLRNEIRLQVPPENSLAT